MDKHEFRHAVRTNATLHVLVRFRAEHYLTGWYTGTKNLCSSGHPTANIVEGYDPAVKPCIECFKRAGLATS